MLLPRPCLGGIAPAGPNLRQIFRDRFRGSRWAGGSCASVCTVMPPPLGIRRAWWRRPGHRFVDAGCRPEVDAPAGYRDRDRLSRFRMRLGFIKRPEPLRVSTDLRRALPRAQLSRSTRRCCVIVALGGLQMGMLDEVINAALGSKAPPAQGQPPQGQPAQDQFSQIAAALQALLAPKQAPTTPGAAPAPAPASAGQQSGLDVLIDRFKQSGLEGLINSWIGTGQNQAISPSQLRQAIGQQTVNNLSRQTGAPPDDLLSQLSRYLPAVIDRLTPNGQLPSQTDLRSGSRSK
jgi:uncharacterized protein YidB (DUF937 family)